MTSIALKVYIPDMVRYGHRDISSSDDIMYYYSAHKF